VALRSSCRVALVALLLAGCANHAKPSATPSSPDYDWADYTGKYAGGVAPPKDGAKPKDEPKAAKPAATTAAAADAPAKPADDKKMSAAKIGGQSVSEVSADDVASASKRALRTSIVSTNVTVGPEYEQINVVLKACAVQIIRPAASPAPDGPKVRSPRARHDDLARTDSGFFDESADVLVLVQAQKKAASKRALSALLQRERPAGKKNVRAVKPRSRSS
jgi:hypothetical protein